MAARDDLSDFFREAAFFRCHPKFQAFERDYKIRFAHGLSECQRLLDSDRDRGLQSLIDALKSPDNNIINWRQNAQLLDWIRESPKRVATVLRNFWWADHGTAGKWEAFCSELSKIGIQQKGAQLTVGSTLLMALSPEDNPPIRTTPIMNAMKRFDWPPLRSIVDVGAKYLAAIQFLDELQRQASLRSINLRDRLDAQSVLWCIYSEGWGKVPPSWSYDADACRVAEQPQIETALAELRVEHDAGFIANTEYEALVKARCGQGNFREKLILHWGRCAVTGCGELALLRASHIKPWRMSTNAERLDPYNGLLLAPNLDAAFDRGFLSFDDDGSAKISERLKSVDRKRLGLFGQLSLRHVDKKHLPYLRFHRENVFDRL